MSIRYIIKEGFEGFRRARVPSFISITTVAFMLILVGIFLVTTVNLSRLMDVFHRKVDIEVFIDNSFDDEKIRKLKTQILALDGIDKAEFISKEMAAQFFKTEFDNDIFEILDDNPLPSSFRLELNGKSNQVHVEQQKCCIRRRRIVESDSDGPPHWAQSHNRLS